MATKNYYRITVSDKYTFDRASKVVELTDLQINSFKAQQKAMKMKGATGFGSYRIYDRSKKKWITGSIIKFEKVKAPAKKKATAKKKAPVKKKATAKKKAPAKKKATGKVKVKGYTVKAHTRSRSKSKRR
jgi:hypothetical protein